MADNERVDLPADIDALLRRTLAVEPSPAFLPRVRERIAEPGRPTRWVAPWMLAGGVAAATLALALAWRPASPAVTPAPPAAPASVVAATARPVPPPPAIQPAASPRPRPVRQRPLRVPQESPDAPVVIVDHRQRAALATLFHMVDRGLVDGESFTRTVPVSLEPIADQLEPIEAPPVAVSAMPPGGVLHNDSKR